MFTNRTRTLPLTYTQPKNGASVYGGKRAGQFLQDLVAGRDSLDIVTIGDSNMGNGTYGYTNGFNRVLNYAFGVPFYATPLFPGSLISGGNVRSGNYWQDNVTYVWCGDNQAGATGTVRTLVQAAAAADADAQSLQTALGYNASNLPFYNGFQWYGAFVADQGTSTTYYHSSGYNNCIELATTHPLNYGSGTGGVALSYRMVHGTFDRGTGQFKVAARNHTDGTIIQTGSYATTNTGANGYKTADPLLFSTPSTTLKAVRCGWDGFLVGNATRGPFACLWHSITAQAQKGVSVSSYIYHGGRTPAVLNTELTDSNLLLNSYLEELRSRQVASGGTGRVLVFVNMGTNGNNDSANDRNGTNYITAANSMISHINSRWTATGGSLSNIAYVFTVTHPARSVSDANWAANRPAFASAVNDWGTNNGGNGVSVVDIAVNYPAIRLSTAGLYDAGGDAHLNSTTTTQANGYDAATHTIVSSLLASV